MIPLPMPSQEKDFVCGLMVCPIGQSRDHPSPSVQAHVHTQANKVPNQRSQGGDYELRMKTEEGKHNSLCKPPPHPFPFIQQPKPIL